MTFKIRASGAGSIMTDPRTKTELLSETCKKYLKQQWIQDNFQREKDLSTPAIQKGLLNEEQGISMLSKKIADMLYKNEVQKENDFCKGTADIIHEDTVYDIKCSFDIFTYGNAALTKDYELQLQVYMQLWDLKKAALVYVLTDTPDVLLHNEVRSILYKTGEFAVIGDDRYEEIYEGLKKQRTYSDIPFEMRIKTFEVAYDEVKLDQIKQRVELCREHYNNLSL